MDRETIARIKQIHERVKEKHKKTYEICDQFEERVYAWMKSLPEEQRLLLDEYLWYREMVYIFMMEIAINEKVLPQNDLQES